MAEQTGRIVEIPAAEIAGASEELAAVPTSRVDGGPAAGAAGAPATRRLLRRSPLAAARSLGAGVTAVGVKELRGRMRGRRAFVILTLYLLFLAAFAWAWELIAERAYGSSALTGGSAAFASALIGQEIFGALLIVETLLVVFLAPAMTAGAISLEREKQTLDMLATTPISSLAIVIGKLFSALTYVFILIIASIPLTAMVFVFGGVGPDEVARGYAVLFVTAIGMGSLGLFVSALLQRTPAATIVTFFGVLALTLGTLFVVLFWTTMAGLGPNGSRFGNAGLGPIKGRPPEALLWFNPFAAQYDVICGASDGYGGWCSRLADVTNGAISIGIGGGATGGGTVVPSTDPGFGAQPAPGEGVIVGGKAIADVAPVQPFGIRRDTFWPRSVAAWIALSILLVFASVQLVSPTRRWRLPFFRRPSRRTA
jgi:ABC-type transport system involved in multi-copper enzyme maturation permease subunit